MATRKIIHAVRDPIKGIQTGDDDNGHGTHVSGLRQQRIMERVS
jgi:subtilisin family serine protease